MESCGSQYIRFRELIFFGLWELIRFGLWELIFFGPWELIFLGLWELGVCCGLWELIFPVCFGQEEGPGGGHRGPKGTCNTLRLVGRKLLSNIIAAVIIFLAAVI